MTPVIYQLFRARQVPQVMEECKVIQDMTLVVIEGQYKVPQAY